MLLRWPTSFLYHIYTLVFFLSFPHQFILFSLLPLFDLFPFSLRLIRWKKRREEQLPEHLLSLPKQLHVPLPLLLSLSMSHLRYLPMLLHLLTMLPSLDISCNDQHHQLQYISHIVVICIGMYFFSSTISCTFFFVLKMWYIALYIVCYYILRCSHQVLYFEVYGM